MKNDLLLLLLVIFMVCHWCQNYDCKFLTYNLRFNRIFFLFWGAVSLLVCLDFLFRVKYSFSVFFTFGQTFKLGRVFNFGQLSFGQTFSFGWTFIWINLFGGRLFIRVVFLFGQTSHSGDCIIESRARLVPSSKGSWELYFLLCHKKKWRSTLWKKRNEFCGSELVHHYQWCRDLVVLPLSPLPSGSLSSLSGHQDSSVSTIHSSTPLTAQVYFHLWHRDRHF